MEELQSYFAQTYYTGPLSLIFAIWAICIAYLRSSSIRQRNIFKLYFISYIPLKLLTYSTYIADYHKIGWAPTIERINFHLDFFLMEPSFWICSGVFIFMISILPYSLFSEYLCRYKHSVFRELLFILYIFYSVLLIMIIKAFLCKPAETR